MQYGMLSPSPVRFGATLSIVRRGGDEDSDLLLRSQTLNSAKTMLASRVAEIQDEKDPIHMTVTLTPEGLFAQFATQRHGARGFQPVGNDTALTFLTAMVEAAETKASTLLSERERQVDDLEKATALFQTVTDAIKSCAIGQTL